MQIMFESRNCIFLNPVIPLRISSKSEMTACWQLLEYHIKKVSLCWVTPPDVIELNRNELVSSLAFT